jgi:hypothetical protein
MYIRPTFLPEATLPPGTYQAELYKHTTLRIATETWPIRNTSEVEISRVLPSFQ